MPSAWIPPQVDLSGSLSFSPYQVDRGPPEPEPVPLLVAPTAPLGPTVTPSPAEPTGPSLTPSRVPPLLLREHPKSGTNCGECGEPVFNINIDAWITGPNEYRRQGMLYPAPCPNEWCPSNQPDRTGRVVRGQEDRVTESGIYLIREPDEE